MNKKALYVPPVCEVNKVAVEKNFLASLTGSQAMENSVETMEGYDADDYIAW